MKEKRLKEQGGGGCSEQDQKNENRTENGGRIIEMYLS